MPHVVIDKDKSFPSPPLQASSINPYILSIQARLSHLYQDHVKSCCGPFVVSLFPRVAYQGFVSASNRLTIIPKVRFNHYSSDIRVLQSSPGV